MSNEHQAARSFEPGGSRRMRRRYALALVLAAGLATAGERDTQSESDPHAPMAPLVEPHRPNIESRRPLVEPHRPNIEFRKPNLDFRKRSLEPDQPVIERLHAPAAHDGDDEN